MSTPFDKLPDNLKPLFQPRPTVRYLPPHDVAPGERRTAPITGVAAFLPALKAKAEHAKASEAGEIKADDENYEAPPTESWLEKRDREAHRKAEYRKWLAAEGIKELYKPAQDPNATADPFKTLFIARLSYDTTKDDLQREFERYGVLERVKIVRNTGQTEQEMIAKGVDPKKISKKKKEGASRGYAFIMFRREEDMKAAYKEMDGVMIKGRRILVDVERGRTVAGWKPKRLGGGLGGRHYTKSVPPRPGGFGFGGPPPGPGFRGGFRGGYRGDGGFRGRGGGFRGGRGGIGYQNGGFPDNAPMGPRGGYGGGGRGGYGGGYNDRGPRNANHEPLPPRGGYRDRDGAGGGGYGSGGDYNDRGHKRRYDDGPGSGGHAGYGDRSRPRY